MARRNLVAALVLLAVGICYAILTTGLPERTLPNTPGPSFFPWLIAGAILLLSVALLGQGLVAARAPGTGHATTPLPRRPVLALLWFAVYLAALPWAGFLWSSIPFFAGLMVLYGGRNWVLVGVSSVAIPVILFYLFRQVFQILLPEAAW